MSARRQGWVLGVYTAFVFAFLFVPVLMVVLFSFNKTSSFTFCTNPPTARRGVTG